ncbi:hypothetical protein ACFRCG_41875 [Embleya sp. NPDC056575]|uniref:hypothetical protein n=1 Tax=unclassified Embleya TaxID=2699296 RepID=UPI0036754C89
MTDTRNADLSYGADDFLVFVAPLGTPKPTDFTALTSPWVNLGWMAKSGGEWTPNEERKELEAAGSLGPIATKITKADRTMKFVAEEAMNPLVRALYDNVSLTTLAPGTGGFIAYDLPDRPSRHRYAFLFCSEESGGKRIWRYMSSGEVTGRGSDNNPTDDYTTIELTITGYPGAGGVPAVSTLIDLAGADIGPFFTSEVQTVTITGSPTGGTFTLTYDSQTTGAIAYNATSTVLKAALEALSNIDVGDVTCAGGPLPGTAITVTFGGGLSGTNVVQMTASGVGLTGGTTPAVTVTTTTGGGTPGLV